MLRVDRMAFDAAVDRLVAASSRCRTAEGLLVQAPSHMRCASLVRGALAALFDDAILVSDEKDLSDERFAKPAE